MWYPPRGLGPSDITSFQRYQQAAQNAAQRGPYTYSRAHTRRVLIRQTAELLATTAFTMLSNPEYARHRVTRLFLTALSHTSSDTFENNRIVAALRTGIHPNALNQDKLGNVLLQHIDLLLEEQTADASPELFNVVRLVAFHGLQYQMENAAARKKYGEALVVRAQAVRDLNKFSPVLQTLEALRSFPTEVLNIVGQYLAVGTNYEQHSSLDRKAIVVRCIESAGLTPTRSTKQLLSNRTQRTLTFSIARFVCNVLLGSMELMGHPYHSAISPKPDSRTIS